ncbi:MAG: lipoate protein ligase C-terminal domain-containing protein [Candidatus Hadarchaeales archaeon]
MGFAELKAPKGVIKVVLEKDGDKISTISISGDFFMYPEEALEEMEKMLLGTKIDREELTTKIKEFYQRTNTQTPMVSVEHWVEAIMKAAES